MFDKHNLLKFKFFLHLGGIHRALLNDNTGQDDFNQTYDIVTVGITGARAVITNQRTGEVKERHFTRTNLAKSWLTRTYKNLHNL